MLKIEIGWFWILLIIGLAIYCSSGCGPLGDSINQSFLCARDGGREYCDPETSSTRRSTSGSGENTNTNGTVGPTGPSGERGPAGEQGPAGQSGTPGTNGTGCIIQQLANGVRITCGSTEAVVTSGLPGVDGVNGTDGRDGEDAPPTAYSVVELIDPCGDQGQFDEVLLRLGNGQLLAHYSEGNGNNRKEFLTIIGPGSYVTTDGTGCAFTVHNDLTVTW